MVDDATQAIGSRSRKSRRALWRKVHLWLGLTLGLPMLIFGVTGSVLVFWKEIDVALNPGIYRVAINPAPPRLQPAVDAAIAAAPHGWESLWLPLPPAQGTALPFNFYYPPPRSSQVGAESLNVFIDPGDDRLIALRTFYHPWNPLKHSFVGFFFKLHYAFFLGAFGFVLVGIIATLLLVSTASGMVVWWPHSGKWRRAFSIKHPASSVRRNYDIHQTAAVYPLLVMLALIISGISFNLPDQFKWLVERVSPVSKTPVSGTQRRAFSIDSALAEAQRRYPGGRLDTLTVPASRTEPITACYVDVPALAGYVQDSRCFVFSGGDGRLITVQDAANGTAGDSFMSWQWPLHSGTIFGWTGRILVFLTGLTCAVLPITGFLRWLQKRRVREVTKLHRGQRGATG